jgi:ferredoxin
LKDSSALERGMKMRVRVDEERREGMGICADSCPEIFKLKGAVAVVKMEEEQEVPKELEEMCRDAAESCPSEAIVLEG